jgi:hypothetical protein
MGREVPQMVEYIHVHIHHETASKTRETVQPETTYINPFSDSFQKPTEIMEEATQTFAKPDSVRGRYEDITTNVGSEFLYVGLLSIARWMSRVACRVRMLFYIRPVSHIPCTKNI